MHSSAYLFAQRLTRRDFLKLGATAAAGLAVPSLAQAEDSKTPVRIGSGSHTYELVENWGQLPPGMKYGFGCSVVVDSQDRVYVTSRSTSPCVAVFDRDGKLLETWSNDFAGMALPDCSNFPRKYAPFGWRSKRRSQRYGYSWLESVSDRGRNPF